MAATNHAQPTNGTLARLENLDKITERHEEYFETIFPRISELEKKEAIAMTILESLKVSVDKLDASIDRLNVSLTSAVSDIKWKMAYLLGGIAVAAPLTLIILKALFKV